jgi:rod shape determining protein RodA
MLETAGRSVLRDLDFTSIFLFYALVLVGCVGIYGAIYQPSSPPDLFAMDNNAGKQLLFGGVSILLASFILVIDYRFWMNSPYILYILTILVLIFVLFVAKDTNGAHAWIEIGSFKLQPSEFSKVTVSMVFAKYFDDNRVKIGLNIKTFSALGLIAVPAVLVLLQNDTGSFLVFACFIFVLYREGLHFLFPLVGLVLAFLFIGTFIIGLQELTIGLVSIATICILLLRRKRASIYLILIILAISLIVIFGSSYAVNDVLQDHQRDRLYAWFEPEAYSTTTAWQTVNSIYAFGHGEFAGRGYLQGELTQMELIPEQWTDFIFCSIGEEFGWLGTLLVLGLYVTFLVRIILVAERQNSIFARVYGYSVASIIFFHFLINVGMEIGLLPVIGIPLPMLSYGGSSLLAFTILVFVLLKLDMHRSESFSRGS